jgi:hypothetical protein
MFSELMKRSNAVWLYNTGRFAEERRTFLCDMVEHGRSGWHTLRQTNRLLLAVAERVNVRQRTPVTERQIAQAAEDWVAKTRSATCSDATRGTSTKRFIFVAKQWLQFLGKWHEPDRDSPTISALDQGNPVRVSPEPPDRTWATGSRSSASGNQGREIAGRLPRRVRSQTADCGFLPVRSQRRFWRDPATRDQTRSAHTRRDRAPAPAGRRWQC